VSKNKFEQLISDNLSSFDEDKTSEIEEQIASRPEGTKRMKSAKWIAIDKICADPAQPRKNFNESSIAELAQSIQEYGVRQPIVVEYIENKNKFRIVSSERRYRAAKIVALHEMPCIVQDKANQSLRFAQQMIENIHREDFSPIDKARAIIEYKGLLGEGRPWSEVEQKIGISESRRKQFVSLLNLPAEIQSEIVAIGKRPSKNQLTEKHARALLMLNKMPDKQAELFNFIRNDKTKITGDEAIEKAKHIKGKKTQLIFRLTYQNREDLIKKLEQALSELKNKRRVT